MNYWMKQTRTKKQLTPINVRLELGMFWNDWANINSRLWIHTHIQTYTQALSLCSISRLGQMSSSFCPTQDQKKKLILSLPEIWTSPNTERLSFLYTTHILPSLGSWSRQWLHSVVRCGTVRRGQSGVTRLHAGQTQGTDRHHAMSRESQEETHLTQALCNLTNVIFKRRFGGAYVYKKEKSTALQWLCSFESDLKPSFPEP